MPDFYDMELDALPEIIEEDEVYFMTDLFQETCEHKTTEYVPAEPEINVQEDNVCVTCGKSLPIPEQEG